MSINRNNKKGKEMKYKKIYCDWLVYWLKEDIFLLGKMVIKVKFCYFKVIKFGRSVKKGRRDRKEKKGKKEGRRKKLISS